MSRLLRSKSARDLRKTPTISFTDSDSTPTPEIPREFRSAPKTPLSTTFEEESKGNMKITAPLMRRKSFSVKRNGTVKETSEMEPMPQRMPVISEPRVLKKKRDPSSGLQTPGYNTRSSSNTSLAPPTPLIGMALGSPSEFARRSPVPSNHSGSPAFAYPNGKYGTDTVVSAGKENEVPAQADGGRGWKKLFGKGFFRKSESSETETSKSRKSSRSRNNTPENGLTSQLSNRDDESSYSNSLMVPIIVEQRAPSPGPLLDVDIPKVEMERYSVMFGSIMQNNNRTSLYARRKSREVKAGNPFLSDEDHPRLFLTTLKRNATTGNIAGARSPRTPRTPRSPDFFSATANLDALRIDTTHLRPVTSRTSLGPSPLSAGAHHSFQRDSIMPSLYFMNQLSQSVPELAEEEEPNFEVFEDEPIVHAITTSTPEMVVISSPESRHSEGSESIKTPPESIDGREDVWLPNEGTWLASPSEDTSHSSPDVEDTMRAAQESIARQISLSQQQLLLPVVRPRSQKAVISNTDALSPRSWENPYRQQTIEEREEEQYYAKAI